MRFSLRSSSPTWRAISRSRAPWAHTYLDVSGNPGSCAPRGSLRSRSRVRSWMSSLAYQNDTRAARPHPCSPSAPPCHRISVEQEPPAHCDTRTHRGRELLRAAGIESSPALTPIRLARNHCSAPSRQDLTCARGRVGTAECPHPAPPMDVSSSRQCRMRCPPWPDAAAALGHPDRPALARHSQIQAPSHFARARRFETDPPHPALPNPDSKWFSVDPTVERLTCVQEVRHVRPAVSQPNIDSPAHVFQRGSDVHPLRNRPYERYAQLRRRQGAQRHSNPTVLSVVRAPFYRGKRLYIRDAKAVKAHPEWRCGEREPTRPDPARPAGPRACSMSPPPTAISRKGPAASPAGFHQVALLSEATATKAPPIPNARLPTVSTIWLCAGMATDRHNSAILIT